MRNGRRTRWRARFAAVLGLGLSVTAGAADLKELSLEELMEVRVPTVTGASKHEQRVTDAPSSVSIVTAEEIRAFGHQTLADVLRSVRGFWVTDDRNYGYIGVRGLNRPGDFGGRTLILIDGQRLNEPIFDSAFNVSDFILDLDLVDRVEVIRGAGSSLYGNNAFFAVINVVTKRGRDVKGVEVAAAGGNLGRYQTRVTYGNLFENGVEVLASGSFLDSHGPGRLYYRAYDLPGSRHGGVARDKDDDQAYNGLVTVSYGDFTLQGAYVEREKQVPTAAYGTTFDDPRFVTVDTRAYVTASYAHTFGSDWVTRARVYYDYYGLDADYPYAPTAPDERDTLNVDADVAHWWGAEGQVSTRLWERHRVTAGAEIRHDPRIAQGNFDRIAGRRRTVLDAESESVWGSLYLQDEVTILPQLLLNAGVRYDHFSTFGPTVNPRVALIWKPYEQTSFKVLYGQAFRAPNAFERDYSGPTQKANPSLDPETVRSVELVWEQYLARIWRFGVGGFYNEIDDLIGQTTDPADGLIVYRNLSQARTQGMDVEVEARTEGGVMGRVSYTLQRTEDADTGREITNSPRHLAKLNLMAPLYHDWLSGGFEVQYSSAVRTLAGRQAGQYWIANANLITRKLAPGLELSCGIYNLFDEVYAYPGAEEHAPIDTIEQNGRTFRVKVVYRF